MKGIIGRTLAGTAICATALVGIGGSPAAAGEMTGNGKSLATVPNPDHDPTNPYSSPFLIKGGSACAYSGQNDGFHDPLLAEGPEDAATRTQTPGGAIRSGLPGRLVGMFCNPTSSS